MFFLNKTLIYFTHSLIFCTEPISIIYNRLFQLCFQKKLPIWQLEKVMNVSKKKKTMIQRKIFQRSYFKEKSSYS